MYEEVYQNTVIWYEHDIYVFKYCSRIEAIDHVITVSIVICRVIRTFFYFLVIH